MPVPGESFAHFKIIEKLGEGGMGEVYLAADLKLNRQVALKTLSSEFLDNRERLERFQREAKTAAQINNAYVMSIYDISSTYDESAGREVSYIVMEYIKGKSLSQYLKEGKLDFADIVRVAEKIATGLAAAHKLNIVHRDIKPDNIIVDEQHNPSILDFGLAKPLDPFDFGEKKDNVDNTKTVSQNLTQIGKIIGTVSYMSPEQVQGQPVDTRSDIFSFGILLYRMVTGDLPFEGPTQVSTMAKILESTPQPLRTKNDNIPGELERIISKCLQKDADDRYQDTRDLVVDLRNLRKLYDSGTSDSISILADTQANRTKSSSSSLSWKRVVLFIFLAPFALGAVALIILGLTGNFSSDEAEEKSGQSTENWSVTRSNGLAILGFDDKTNDESLHWLQTGLPEILLTDLANHSVSLIGLQRIVDFLPMEQRKNFTHDAAVDAAGKLGATRVLSGSFYKLGEKLRIDARVEEVSSGKILWSGRVVGDDPFALVDSLTNKIAAELQMSLAIGGSDASGTVFASMSPEAYKLYLEGMELFGTGFLEESIESFNKALAVDSTFALPYMRIGMANVFLGRSQLGASYFAKALEYKEKLPSKERNLLDIYADLWLNKKFDDAFVKMETAVSNYPDDKEMRAINGLLISTFTKDTLAAYAQLDTALMIDPGFPMALSLYTIVLERHQDFDRAIFYAEKLREYFPQSPSAYDDLPRLYRRQGRLDDAIAVAEDYLAAFPDLPAPYLNLASLNIRKRDFDVARTYLNRMAVKKRKDPFIMMLYNSNMASLADWKGQFNTSMDYRFKGLDEAYKTEDSTRVFQALNSISIYFGRFDINDSALYYSLAADKMANVFGKISYPLTLVEIDQENDSIARPLIQEALNNFRSRLPSEFWPVADGLEQVYEGMAARDTSLIITGLRGIIEADDQRTGSNARTLGFYLVNYGKLQEGIDILTPMLSGNEESVSGFNYPKMLYFVGKAYEGLGDHAKAVSNYREMLTYWSDPEIELKELIDARERLAKLTS